MTEYQGYQQPQSEEAQRVYQRGWDDCLLRVYQVLGEKFTLPKGLPSAADDRLANKASSVTNGEGKS